jgi:hypothetical protein
VNGGWGTADVGGKWQTSGNAAAINVTSSVGTLLLQKPSALASAVLMSSLAHDVDIRVRVRTSLRASAAPFYAYLIVRGGGSNEYRPKLLFQSDGTLAVHASVLVGGIESPLTATKPVGLNYSAAQWYWLHVQVTGSSPTTIKVKTWAAGTQEPAAWQLIVTDSHASVQGSGQLGLRAYFSSRSTSGPVEISFDDYRVRTVP